MLGPFAKCEPPLHCQSPVASYSYSAGGVRCAQRRRQQRQRVTEGTAMAPWNGPNQSRFWLRCSDRLFTTDANGRLCCRVGQQSAFTRQWNLAPLSCVHPTRREINTCCKTPLFDVEPLGPYTNECHIALEVCLSVCFMLGWIQDMLVAHVSELQTCSHRSLRYMLTGS